LGRYIPTTIAHALITIRGTRLHHNTLLTPHFSATKLNGMVTTKSDIHSISSNGFSLDTILINHIPNTTLIVSILPCSHASFL